MNRKSSPIPCLTVVSLSLLLLSGCAPKGPTPKDIVAKELNYLVNGQAQTTAQKALLTSLFPADEKNEKTDLELAQTFDLFFKDFSYNITNSSIKDNKAIVDVDLTTIDANTLAKDFISQSIIKQIQGSTTPNSVTYSSNDYYHSLYLLLSSKNYPTIDSKCSINLTQTENGWQIDPHQHLDDHLTGGFVRAVSDPNLFTPEEIATIYLDTIKAFDKEQMNQFFSLDTLFSADDEYKRQISQSLTEQILKYFDYEILSSNTNGKTATVTADIISYDATSVIQNFSDQMATYTATSQALQDGIGGRLTKAYQVLTDCINQNTDTKTTQIILSLNNDGIIWELNLDEALGQAILGNVQEALAGQE